MHLFVCYLHDGVIGLTVMDLEYGLYVALYFFLFYYFCKFTNNVFRIFLKPIGS